MKHIFIAIAIISTLLTVSSCKKASYMNIDDEMVFMGVKGGEKDVVIHSDANHFKTLYSPSWTKVTYKDSIMSVNFSVNDSKSLRKDYIIVANDEQKSSIPVIQATRASYFMTNDDQVTINKEGGPNELVVNTDGFLVTADVPDNVKVEYQYGKLLFSNEGNDGKTRKTKIHVHCEDFDKEVLLIEKGNICGTCGGKGTVVCEICHGSGMIYCPVGTCPNCWGRGRVKCPDCGGK